MEESFREIEGTQYRVLGSEQAIEGLEKGETLEGVYIDHLKVGVAFAGQRPIPYGFKIQIKNSRIGSLAFHGAIFEEEILFEGVHFEKSLLLGNTREDLQNLESPQILPPNEFKKAVTLRGCTFEKMVDFTGSSFQDMVTIETSTLKGVLNLGKNYLGGSFHLKGSICEGPVTVKRVTSRASILWDHNTFQGKIKILNSSFGKIFFKHCDMAGGFQIEFVDLVKEGRIQNNTFSEAVRIFTLTTAEVFTLGDNHFKKDTKIQSLVVGGGMVLIRSTFDGELSFKKCQIKENLNLGGGLFRGKTYLEDLEVAGEASFTGAIFENFTSFKQSRFQGEALFMEALFKGKVDFRFAKMRDRASFSSTHFDSEANFYRALFSGPVFFLGTRFKDVSFVNTAFHEQVFFSFDRNTLEERNRQKMGGKEEFALMFVSSFDGTANFTNALFYKKAIFENIFFKEPVSFKNAYFNEEISFINAHFLRGASFEGVYCSMELNFTNGLFSDYVNFDKANINRRLNLGGTAIDHGISFYNAIIDVVVVERDQIDGQLIYEGRLSGKEDALNHFKVKEEYLILKESYQQRGKFQEEDWAYYRYRVNDRKSLTKKAWQSLRGTAITEAIEAESSKEEEYQKVLKDVMPGYKKAQRELERREKALSSVEAAEGAKSEEHQKYIDSEEYKISREQKIEKSRRELEEAREHYRRASENKEKIEEIIELDKKRLGALKNTQQSPYSKGGALWRFMVSGGWLIVDWSTGYGVKPFRIALIAAVLILIYTTVYLVPFVPPLSGGEWPSISFVVNTLNFSALAFVTEVTSHPILNKGVLMNFLVVSEAFLGLFFMALFVGCYTRKIIR